MRKVITLIALMFVSHSVAAYDIIPDTVPYTPTEANIQSRQAFRDAGWGIFLHWGIYSVYGQGEWYMSTGNLKRESYRLAANVFNPYRFDADEWVKAIKQSGAKYICFTSRHHDGFSMWATRQSKYNIVDATPYHRDILRQLADACHRQGIRLHLYYSLVDWDRDDYPVGESARHNGRDTIHADYDAYMQFMKAQLTELLTEYGEIGAIWLDGIWDHRFDSVPFDWRQRELYDLIHRLQPACLVANNHHLAALQGEDIQCFEHSLPGENTVGYNVQEVSQELPLETNSSMNWAWGYRVDATDYMTVDSICSLRKQVNALGANLLLNIGPLPDGTLPQPALERLKALESLSIDMEP